MGLATADSEENVLGNRARFLTSLGISSQQVAVGRLVHGKDVSVFRRNRAGSYPLQQVSVRPGSERSQQTFGSDAVISDVPGLYFLLTFADCTPLIFRDRRSGAIGAAHGGWRGAALGIAGAVVEAMRNEFGSDPAELEAGIGPCIGPCCYPVAEDVPAAFRSNGLDPVVLTSGIETRLDLAASHREQLRAAGVPEGSIESPRICTGCNVSTFFSHRAEGGTTGRFALCIGLD